MRSVLLPLFISYSHLLACKTSQKLKGKKKKKAKLKQCCSKKQYKSKWDIFFASWLPNTVRILMELQSISNTTWNRCEFMPVLQTKSICLQLVLTCTFISRSISQPEAKIKSIKNLRWKCWNWSRNSYFFLQKPNQRSDLILLSKFVSTTWYTYVSISKTLIYIKYWLAKQNTGNLNMSFL